LFHHSFPTMMLYVTSGAKQWDQVTMAWMLWNPESKSSLFNLLLSWISYSNKKLTNKLSLSPDLFHNWMLSGCALSLKRANHSGLNACCLSWCTFQTRLCLLGWWQMLSPGHSSRAGCLPDITAIPLIFQSG
jgi:hypothetical protein